MAMRGRETRGAPASWLLPHLVSGAFRESPQGMAAAAVCPMPHLLFVRSSPVRCASEAGSVGQAQLAGWQGAQVRALG